VSDAGIVTGSTTHTDVVVMSQDITWQPTDGPIQEQSDSGYYQDRNTHSTVFTWDPHLDAYQEILANHAVIANADDADIVIGTNLSADVVSLTDYVEYPVRDDIYVVWRRTVYDEWANNVYSAWYMDRSAPIPAPVSLGPNTRAYDISENGEAIVGCSMAPDGFNTENAPMLWLIDEGTDIELTMPAGMQTGRATAVAFVTTVDLTTTNDD
jgi:hypothetical protein